MRIIARVQPFLDKTVHFRSCMLTNVIRILNMAKLEKKQLHSGQLI